MDVIEEALKRIDDRVEFYKWAKSLNEGEKLILLEGVKDFPTVAPSDGPQTLAFTSPAKVLGYGGAAGGGKAQPLNAEIQTPYGPKKMGDIQVGDAICDPFGGVQSVRGLQDFHKWSIMRVTFDDATCIECSPEHEWFGVWSDEAHLLEDRVALMGMGVRRCETAEIMRSMEDEGRTFLVPIADAHPGNESLQTIVNPLMLAAWIRYGTEPVGDGKARIVMPHDESVLAVDLRDGCNETLGVIDRGDFLSISLPSGIYSDLLSFSRFDVSNNGFSVYRLSSNAYTSPAKWREQLLLAMLRVCGREMTPSKDGCREWFVDPLRENVTRDIVSLARGAGAWASLPVVSEGMTQYAIVRLPLDMISPPRLTKEVKLVEKTDRYCDMRCISVSHRTGSYLTDNHTITHNSALIALLAYLRHQKTVIFRSDAKQLDNLIDDLRLFAGSDKGLNMQRKRFSFHGKADHFVEWGGLDDMTSITKWRGRAHDLFAVDEATEVPLAILKHLMTWMRSTTAGQRVRAVFTFNPPGLIDEATGIVPQGRWVMDYFAPWIDENYKDPLGIGKAEMGELRWFISDEEGKEKEVHGEGPHEVVIGGKPRMVKAQSRTFIPALFWDNPYLNEQYGDDLAMLEEPERGQLMLGHFTSDITDSPYRVFPTKWVEEAMDRWTDAGEDAPITAIGCDVARDGADRTCIARRHGLWFNKLILPPKKANEILDGDAVAKHCINVLRAMDVDAEINIDEIGIGSSPFDSLRRFSKRVNGVNSSKTNTPSLPGRFKAYNMRAYLHWLLRVLLDPKYGFKVSLPNDSILRNEMMSIHYYNPQEKGGKIQIESKLDIRKRIRRSPDRLDAIVLSLFTFRHEPEYDRLMSAGNSMTERQTDYDSPDDPIPIGQMDAKTAMELKEFYRQRRRSAGRPNSWMGAL